MKTETHARPNNESGVSWTGRRATIGRRGVLRAGFGVSAALLLAACGGQSTVDPSSATASAGAPPTQAPAPTSSAPPPATAAPTGTRPALPATAVAQPTVTPAAAAAGPSPMPPVIAQPAVSLAPTPACADDDDVTPAQTEGPYYTRNTPERASLIEPGMAGTTLTLTGRVLSTTCQPVARALLDFWQSDDRGQYDNAGYTLRGHQFADAQGNFRLETIVPGLYPGRTRHIHVKVQAPSRPVLTSQLYFPGESGNGRDGIFNPKLVMAVQDASGGGKLATFDFVLDLD